MNIYFYIFVNDIVDLNTNVDTFVFKLAMSFAIGLLYFS